MLDFLRIISFWNLRKQYFYSLIIFFRFVLSQGRATTNRSTEPIEIQSGIFEAIEVLRERFVSIISSMQNISSDANKRNVYYLQKKHRVFFSILLTHVLQTSLSYDLEKISSSIYIFLSLDKLFLRVCFVVHGNTAVETIVKSKIRTRC